MEQANGRNTAFPAEKDLFLLASSVVNQLRVLYPLFRKALPFFVGVLQVVLKIRFALKEFGCEGQNTLFLYRRGGFVPIWAGFENLHNIIQEAAREILIQITCLGKSYIRLTTKSLLSTTRVFVCFIYKSTERDTKTSQTQTWKMNLKDQWYLFLICASSVNMDKKCFLFWGNCHVTCFRHCFSPHWVFGSNLKHKIKDQLLNYQA